MRLDRDAVEYPPEFVWYRRAEYCEKPRYTMKSVPPDRGATWSFGIDQERTRIDYLQVSCGERNLGWYEVLRDGRLALYWDGYFVFFEREHQ
jgi:hypothetical protein